MKVVCAFTLVWSAARKDKLERKINRIGSPFLINEALGCKGRRTEQNGMFFAELAPKLFHVLENIPIPLALGPFTACHAKTTLTFFCGCCGKISDLRNII